ncbi:MAG: hypothetical protein IRZ14_10175 [Chloroflexi bacterium]|nr:hypothetical protein [Chloroflexota bacterium]
MIKVSTVYRYYQRLAPTDDTARARAVLFAPPFGPHQPGRWLLLAILCGGALWLATGFAVVWLVLGLCLGVMGEIALLFEYDHRRATLQAAMDCWRSAYYCGTHDRVLLADATHACSPEEFVRRLYRPGAPEPVPAAPPALSAARPPQLG